MLYVFHALKGSTLILIMMVLVYCAVAANIRQRMERKMKIIVNPAKKAKALQVRKPL